MSSATIAGNAEACCIIVCNIHRGKFLQGQIAEIVQVLYNQKVQ